MLLLFFVLFLKTEN